MSPIEARLLASERRMMLLGDEHSRAKIQVRRVWQNMIDPDALYGGGGGGGFTYTFYVTNVTNGLAVPLQDVELVDHGTSSVVATGTTDASGYITFTVPAAVYRLHPGLSGGRQRFDPTTYFGLTTTSGGSVGWLFVENTGYTTLAAAAFPVSNSLQAQDPMTSINQTMGWSGSEYWVASSPTNFGFPGYAGCPAKTAGITYSAEFTALELTAEYPATAGGCPDNAAGFLGQSVADITVVDGNTPVITAVPRASQKIWSGGTSTITVIEL